MGYTQPGTDPIPIVNFGGGVNEIDMGDTNIRNMYFTK